MRQRDDSCHLSGVDVPVHRLVDALHAVGRKADPSGLAVGIDAIIGSTAKAPRTSGATMRRRDSGAGIESSHGCAAGESGARRTRPIAGVVGATNNRRAWHEYQTESGFVVEGIRWWHVHRGSRYIVLEHGKEDR